jgi:sulfur carrier protein
VTVTVNGDPRTCAPGTTVADLMAALGFRASGTAVAVNGEIVPRGTWPARGLADGDDVDVLTAVQGG